ncbi:hypothetical protein [Pedobacter chitinilyticus]|uniref:Uncharacterized protein n=1 Tax=Pedobacter chitinilyticus TaxID=2233776 RepID=A0A3S3PI37_9SPHI|nr:hypothetical protein [Pedobacter chitinilyticus]RWU09946.1 hypothetical protein DPV69_00950 [Pedobacter chitinilyticus]
MKLLYVLFFCASLLMLFVNLNHPRILDKKIVVGFWITFLITIAFHFILSVDFLLPATAVQIPVVALVFIIIAHYTAEQQKESALKSETLDEQAKSLRVKMTNLFFQRIIYVLVFILILMNILGS